MPAVFQPLDFLGVPFWAAENRRLVAILRPLLQEAAELGVGIAEEDLMQFEVGFDNALANAEAADWARRHTDELLMQLGTTTRKQVDSIIANWFTTPGGLVGEFIEVPGMTLGDLSTALERVLGFNRSRAQMIARTESTRASFAGQEISRQAAGLPRSLYGPPSHPRCRCWSSEDLLSDGTWVTIFQTRRDEIVCFRPLDTPLGEMQGCRDLHGRVISEGPYFGMPIEDARAIAAARAEGQERVTAEQAAAELAGAIAEYEAWQAGGRSVPVKFDPAQPRDEGGRWISTGVASYGKGHAPVALTDEMSEEEYRRTGAAGAVRAEQWYTEDIPNRDWRNASTEQREKAKNEICQDLLEEMEASSPDLALDAEQAWAIEDKYNETYGDVNDLVGQWSMSSNDADMRSLAIQRDAAAEFGVELSEFTQGRINDQQDKLSQQRDFLLKQGLSSSAAEENLMKTGFLPLTDAGTQRPILRAMYNHTQAQLRDAGFRSGDRITLYRGVELQMSEYPSVGKVGQGLSLGSNVLESWSLGLDVAKRFAIGSRAEGVIGVALKMSIPVEAIMGSARTGLGCLTEGEFVVLGIPGEARVEYVHY